MVNLHFTQGKYYPLNLIGQGYIIELIDLFYTAFIYSTWVAKEQNCLKLAGFAAENQFNNDHCAISQLKKKEEIKISNVLQVVINMKWPEMKV